MKYTNDVIYVTEPVFSPTFGDDSGDITSGRGGNDLIFGREVGGIPGQGDALYGDANNLRGDARGGNDAIYGRGGADLLHGDAAVFLTDGARGGNDWLFGEDGNDMIRGDSLWLNGQARGGNDCLDGGAGNDQLLGDATFLAGQAHGGNDWLNGGAGNDMLWGDAMSVQDDAAGGHDIFFFSGAFGEDEVMDFRDGEDVLAFAVPGVDGLEDLQVAVVDGNTVITAECQGSVTLVGFTGGLGAGDILFA